MILWNTHALALAIADKRLSPKLKFQYLLFNYCMYSASGYFGWLFMNPPSGWLFWYEGFLVLVLTYFGLLRCQESYEGNIDDRLLENCVILGVPLGLKFILFTWLAHLTVGKGVEWLTSNLVLESNSIISLVNFLISATYRFYAFIITAVATGVYYLRLREHLGTIAACAEDPEERL